MGAPLSRAGAPGCKPASCVRMRRECISARWTAGHALFGFWNKKHISLIPCVTRHRIGCGGVSGTTGGFVLPDAVAPPPAHVPAPPFAICLDKGNPEGN